MAKAKKSTAQQGPVDAAGVPLVHPWAVCDRAVYIAGPPMFAEFGDIVTVIHVGWDLARREGEGPMPCATIQNAQGQTTAVAADQRNTNIRPLPPVQTEDELRQARERRDKVIEFAMRDRDVNFGEANISREAMDYQRDRIAYWQAELAARAKRQAMEVAKPTVRKGLFIDGGGRVTCGQLRCTGMAAFYSGMKTDLHGARIVKATPEEAQEWLRDVGTPMACESCGETIEQASK